MPLEMSSLLTLLHE